MNTNNKSNSMHKVLQIVIWSQIALYLSGMPSLRAQVSIPGPGAQWTYYDNYADPYEDLCFERITYVVYVANDSTIHDKQYALLKLKQIHKYSLDYFSSLYCYVDTINHELGTIGGIRTQGEKTYFYSMNNLANSVFRFTIPDTTDILLYDFSKNVGDTIQFVNTDGVSTYDSITEVNNVTYADGLVRKQFKASCPDVPYNSFEFIEGIGDYKFGPLGSLFSAVSTSFIKMTCYNENDNYLIADETCGIEDATFETPPLEGHKIFTYPSPFDNYFRYEIPYDHSIIRIYSTDGKLQLEFYSELPNGIIHPSSLNSGTYIITCTSSEGKVAYDVIVKSIKSY